MKTISYSFFLSGTISSFGKYIIGVVETIESRNIFFPNWNISIYYDYTVINNKYGYQVLQWLKTQKDVDLHLVKDMEEYPIYVKAGYRFLSRENPVLFRDLDSPLTLLDSDNVENWLNSSEKVLQYYSVPNNTSFAGGGTGIKDITLSDYQFFVSNSLSKFKQLYNADKDARNFDEWYLSIELKDSLKLSIPMVLIKKGSLRGRWYMEKDISKKNPLLSFINGQ